MTLAEAKTLKKGDMVYHITHRQSTGPWRARVTSVKTWKTRPNEVEVHLKHGLYQYPIIYTLDLPNFTIKEPET